MRYALWWTRITYQSICTKSSYVLINGYKKLDSIVPDGTTANHPKRALNFMVIHHFYPMWGKNKMKMVKNRFAFTHFVVLLLLLPLNRGK
jgi:hypothetical protein